MEINNQCQIKEHQNIKPIRICTLKDCDQVSRWACDACIIEKLHKHGLSDEEHLKSQMGFKLYIQQQQQQNKNSLLSLSTIEKFIPKLNKILYLTKMLILQLEECQKYKQKYDEMNYNELISQSTSDFKELDNTQIDNKLININQHRIELSSQNQQDILKNIINYCQELSQQISENKKEVLSQEKQIIKLEQQQQFTYEDYFEQQDNNEIYTLQISPNEQLIAYGGFDKILTVVSLDTKQKVKQIKFDSIVITCSDDRFIILSDVKKHKQLLQIANLYNICQIEYDPINQVIISCSCDKSIKFFLKQNGKILINSQNSHDDEVLQIQLINKNHNLLSRSFDELRLWQIDYQHHIIKLIRKFEEVQIQSFSSLLNDRAIIIIDSQQLKILDNNFKLVSQLNHDSNLIWSKILLNNITINYIFNYR